MYSLFLTILNMSLTGAFVIAAICLVRLPLKKAPKILSYCLWAVAGFRLVFPFSIESMFSLIPFMAQTIPQNITAAQPVDGAAVVIDNTIHGAAQISPLQIGVTIGSYVWLIGAAAMLIYGIASYLLLKRRMRCAAQAGPNIYESEHIQSPFVLGVLKPSIYLPRGLSEQERRYILLHEQTHLQRCDHIIKCAAYFILCLHWFNPLVWAAFYFMGADMEMSCDERVMKELGGEIKKDYSLTLLSLATERRAMGVTPLAFSEGGVKRRIQNVLNFKKPSRMIMVAAVALVVILSVGFAVNKVGIPQSQLQKMTGATSGQAEQIERLLDMNGVSYQTIADSVNPITAGMDTNYQAYDLFAEDGSSYVLILRTSDHDFTAVLDDEGNIIWGLIDNDITPALFTIGGWKFNTGEPIGSMDDESGVLIEEDRVIYVAGRKAVHMTFAGYDAWVAAGENGADVYDYAERVLYTPIGTDKQIYMTIDDYKAWAAAGENDADVSDFSVPYTDDIQ